MFYSEVLDSLQRTLEENIKVDNLILEINSSKYAYNIAMHELIPLVIKSILEVPQLKSPTPLPPAQLLLEVKKVSMQPIMLLSLSLPKHLCACEQQGKVSGILRGIPHLKLPLPLTLNPHPFPSSHPFPLPVTLTPDPSPSPLNLSPTPHPFPLPLTLTPAQLLPVINKDQGKATSIYSSFLSLYVFEQQSFNILVKNSDITDSL